MTQLQTAVGAETLPESLRLLGLGVFSTAACTPNPQGQCGCGRGHTEPHAVGKAVLPFGYTADGLRPSADLLRLWFTRKYPRSNLAILLKQSGLVDIAPDSPEWLREFQRKGLPRTACFASGGGEGHLHFLYRRPEGAPVHRICRSGQFDILSNGVAIAPPSVHRSGRPYRWLVRPERVGELPEAPSWAVEMLRQAAQSDPIPTVELPRELPQMDLRRLRVPLRVKALILCGARPGQFPSSSEAEWAVLRALVKAHYTDAEIAAVLLDPATVVGERVRIKPRGWLAGEIARARHAVESPRLLPPVRRPDGVCLPLLKRPDGVPLCARPEIAA